MTTSPSPQATTLDARAILDELLRAETESQVHECLKGHRLLDKSHWRPYGGVENNGGSFLNQQASPQGALVEKVVNSVDAVFMAKAQEWGDLPANPPPTMFKAAERYFNIPEGRLAEIGPADRRRVASKSVQVVFSGKKPPGQPTITIADQGEGQDPRDFPTTFLSLAAKNKFRIPFVQGKFNMGSTGAVPFCGRQHNYQLILSRRRHMDLAHEHPWGFTVVRRRSPEDNERLSEFQFLIPYGDIMSFQSPSLPIWAAAGGRFDDIPYGSLVRLYEYSIPEKTNAILDFSRMLNRRLFRTPLPIQVVESRTFKAHTLENIVPGLDARLIEDTSESLEDGFPTTDRITVDGVGDLDVSLAPFKEGTDTKHWMKAQEAVIFTVNGQAHAFESRDFLRRRGDTGVGLGFLAPSLLVEVDCSRLSPRVIEQLFMASRDRMRDIDEKRALLVSLTTYLRQHQGLRELNNVRRINAIKSSTQSDGSTQKLFQRMVASSSAIAALLRGAGRIPAPVRVTPGPGVTFAGRRFPTYLQWQKRVQFLQKQCPVNSYCEVHLETDAENDFLSRPRDAGICRIEPATWTTSRKLWNGKLSIRLRPPPGTRVGERVPLRVSFESPVLVAPLRVEGRLIVGPAQKKKTKPNSPPPPPKKAAVAPPDIREVLKPDWSTHGFNERSVACVDIAEKATTIFVNMDNRGLNLACYAEPKRAYELKEMYKLAGAALAVSLDSAVQKGIVQQDAADKALAAVGDVLVPAVDFAG
ncbi:MAG: hypothetical protein F4174_06075, partial [Acidobacteria bacterium]|nr:hypothetical protein [Acidobacteriota bacterium]